MSHDIEGENYRIAYEAEKSLWQITIVLGIVSIVCFIFGLMAVGISAFMAVLATKPEAERRTLPTLPFAQYSELMTPQFMSYLMIFSAVIYIIAAILLILACFFARQRKNYLFVISVCALCTLQFPIGTCIGVFCLMNLNKKPVKALFGPAKVPQVPPG